MSIQLVMPSNHLILCRPLLLPPSIFPSIGSFPMSHFFVSGGQSIRASASASVLPMNSPSNYELLMLPFPPQPASPHSKGHLQPPLSQAKILESCLTLSSFISPMSTPGTNPVYSPLWVYLKSSHFITPWLLSAASGCGHLWSGML